MKYTENYGFDKPEGTDFVDVEHFNTNAEMLDKILCPEYSEEKEVTELKSGEKLAVGFGKIATAVKHIISHIKDTTIHFTAKEREKLKNIAEGATKNDVDSELNTTSENPVQNKIIQAALTKKYDSEASRTKNTVLAAPTDANGAATFRNLTEDDLPNVYALKESVIPYKSRQKNINLMAPGWYRIAKLTASELNVINGAISYGCEIILKRAYTTVSNEHHEIKFANVHGNSFFVSGVSRSNTQLITKIRHTIDSANKATYLEVYYSGGSTNIVSVLLNDAVSYGTKWDLINPEATEETADGISIYSTKDIPANSRFECATVKNLTTTVEGSALDATMGKVLQDEIDEINTELAKEEVITISIAKATVVSGTVIAIKGYTTVAGNIIGCEIIGASMEGGAGGSDNGEYDVLASSAYINTNKYMYIGSMKNLCTKYPKLVIKDTSLADSSCSTLVVKIRVTIQ